MDHPIHNRIATKLNRDRSSVMTARILDWSNHLTAEGKRKYKYFWPKKVQSLAERLQLVKGSLICVTGLQGTGKSSALKQLSITLSKNSMKIHERNTAPNAILVRWGGTRNWESVIHDELMRENGYRSFYVSKLVQFVLIDKNTKTDLARLESLANLMSRTYVRRDPNDIRVLEDCLSQKHLQTLIHNSLVSYFSQSDTILIDTRDFSTTDTRMINSDMAAIQELWKDLTNLKKNLALPNLVLALQREITDKRPSFFLGKFDIIQLEALRPAELVRAYRLQWGNTDPFEPEALLLVAQLARGVFRRFLRYISLIIQNSLNSKEKVGTVAVSRIISDEVVGKDMELELRQIFPKSRELQKKAVQLLYFLTTQPEGLAQNKIAKKLGLKEMEVSRVVDRLEIYDYARRKSGARAEKIVHLIN